MMKKLRSSLGIAAIVLLAFACNKQAHSETPAQRVHAEVVNVAAEFTKTWKEFTDTACPTYVSEAATVDEVNTREAQCLRAVEGQHVAVEAVQGWALAALKALEGQFEFSDIAPFIGRFISTAKEVGDLFPVGFFPEIPPVILQLARHL